MKKISFAGYRFAPEIIRPAIWLYLRFGGAPLGRQSAKGRLRPLGAKKPRGLCFRRADPGVDVATKLVLYRLIRGLADEGAAVVLISSDLRELIGLTDRILT